MILSTTPAIEGHTIREYKGVVFGEVITGVNFLKDFAASIRNFVGGRSGSYENERTGPGTTECHGRDGSARPQHGS